MNGGIGHRAGASELGGGGDERHRCSVCLAQREAGFSRRIYSPLPRAPPTAPHPLPNLPHKTCCEGALQEGGVQVAGSMVAVLSVGSGGAGSERI